MSVTIYPCSPDGRPIPGAPEANFANANARPLIVSLGLGVELWGMVEASEVPSLIETAQSALGADATALEIRAQMLREIEHEGRVCVFGSDDARARERVREVLMLLCWAERNGCGLAWN